MKTIKNNKEILKCIFDFIVRNILYSEKNNINYENFKSNKVINSNKNEQTHYKNPGDKNINENKIRVFNTIEQNNNINESAENSNICDNLERINKVRDNVSDTDEINNDDEITNKLIETCDHAKSNNDIESCELENEINNNLYEVPFIIEDNFLQNKDNLKRINNTNQ